MNEDEPKKLWNGTKKKAKLDISIYGRKNAIGIGKDVIRVLGGPSHVCLKIKEGLGSFMITPCAEKDTMSFRVPDNIMFDRHVQMKVTSQSFVIGLLAMNDLEFHHTYKITGVYSEKNNAVVFDMKDIWIYGEEVKEV